MPIILAGTGLAGAWTLHLQLIVGPYERWWFWGSILMLGLGAIAWGREIWRVAARGDSRASVMVYAITPLFLTLGVVMLVGTLMVEHASLADFL